MNITDCEFLNNKGTKGGVVYATEISTNTYKSSLTITKSTFYNSSTTSHGGSFYISHSAL